jgi:prevent-host-death family protein
MQISVREFKNHLSKYLKLVRGGEAVIITSHKRPIARLISIETDESDDLMMRLTSIPGVIWRGGKPTGTCVVLADGEKTAAEIVLEDRQ